MPKRLLPYLVLLLVFVAGCSRQSRQTATENLGNSPQQQVAQPAPPSAGQQQIPRPSPAVRQPGPGPAEPPQQAAQSPEQSPAVPETAPPPADQPQTADAPQPVFSAPAGAVLRVRLDQTLDTRRNRPGDRFTATLVHPVTVDRRVLIPSGTRFTGVVAVSRSSGRLRGRGRLGVRLVAFRLRGTTYRIASTYAARVSKAHKRRNIEIIGGGGGVGSVIGAIAGGGVGAAIGAGAGAAAGTVTAAVTGRRNVHLPAESLMVFRLETPVRVRG
jgi:hypothetical protein